METKEVILASLNESWGYLNRALNGVTEEETTWTLAPHSNSLAFILWHVTRAEDWYVNDVIRRGSTIYETEGWRGCDLTYPRKTLRQNSLLLACAVLGRGWIPHLTQPATFL